MQHHRPENVRTLQCTDGLVPPVEPDPSQASHRQLCISVDPSVQEEEFYGFGSFFSDLEREWGERRKRRQKEPSSLWEELADLGEEFVEFLERELGLPPIQVCIQHSIVVDHAHGFESEQLPCWMHSEAGN